MDAEVRHHLAELVEESLQNGFERIELEREAEREARPHERSAEVGYMLTLSGPGRERGAVFVIERVLATEEGAQYVAGIADLIRGWAEQGIPEQDRVPPREPARTAPPISDLGFLVRCLIVGRGLVSIAQMLLVHGAKLSDLASAFREALVTDADCDGHA